MNGPRHISDTLIPIAHTLIRLGPANVRARSLRENPNGEKHRQSADPLGGDGCETHSASHITGGRWGYYLGWIAPRSHRGKGRSMRTNVIGWRLGFHGANR